MKFVWQMKFTASFWHTTEKQGLGKDTAVS